MFRLNTEVAAVYKEMNSLEAGNKWSPRQKVFTDTQMTIKPIFFFIVMTLGRLLE